MKTKTYFSSWRSSEAEKKFRELNADEWERSTDTPPTALDVATSFGPTRAYRWPGNGPPVVFLHGMGDTSIRWIRYAEELTDHDVYAIDIMGDVGSSKPEVGFASAADYITWLDETIDGLGLTKPCVVGASMGGYIALGYAMAPNRAASTVAFEPVGVVKLQLVRFMAWGFTAMLGGSFAPESLRGWLARRLCFPAIEDKEAVRTYLHGQRNHPPKPPPLPVFTDEEMASIDGPLRILAGAKSVAFNVERMTERIRHLVPRGEADLLSGAGHALTDSHFDDCLAAVRDALAAGTDELRYSAQDPDN